MKFCLVLLVLVGFTLAKPADTDRGCIYILGKCSSQCPEGTHSYTTGCGYLQPEATCEDPEPEKETRGMICDYSACYCDPPTVRDTTTDKCVPLDQCPKKSE